MSEDKINAAITIHPCGVHVCVEPGGEFNTTVFRSTERLSYDRFFLSQHNDVEAMLVGKAVAFALHHSADLLHVSLAEPVLMSQDVSAMLPVVADSWEKLRASDCYRLIDCFDHDLHNRIGKVIKYYRPDLADATNEALADLEADQFG